jgi:hypothetical protein
VASKLKSALSAYAVCERMGHCGDLAARTKARETPYSRRVLQAVKYRALAASHRGGAAAFPGGAAAAGGANATLADRLAAAALKGFSWFPRVDSVSPPKGSTGGGTKVTLTGEGFTRDAVCLLGKTTARSTSFINSTMIVCETPHRNAPGVVMAQVFGRNQNGDASLSVPGSPFRYTVGYNEVPGVVVNATAAAAAGSALASGKVSVWKGSWARLVHPGERPVTDQVTLTEDGPDLQPLSVVEGGRPLVRFGQRQLIRVTPELSATLCLGAQAGGMTIVAVVRPAAARKPPHIPFLVDFGARAVGRGLGFAVATNYLGLVSPAQKGSARVNIKAGAYTVVTAQFLFRRAQRARINGGPEWALNQPLRDTDLPDLARTTRIATAGNSGRFTLGGDAQVPGDPLGGFEGDIADIRVYAGALDKDQLRSVEEHLAGRYGIKLGDFELPPVKK